MSGIYGVASTNSIDSLHYKNLSKWNENYGDQPEEKYSDDHIFFGIKLEKMKTYEYKNVIHKIDSFIGIADSLIFSPIVSDSSDEDFITSTICKNGIDAIKDINGDFAGAIWVKNKNELILYRDHVGVRPLFYYKDAQRVIFSSDIRGISSIDDVDTSADENWIYYSATRIYAPSVTDTEYKNIKCVPPGGYIRFSFNKNGIDENTGRYWIPGEKKIKMKSREAYTKELRKLVEDAVRIRANATDFKIGAELSGGLDSGVISLLLAQMGKECFYYSWTPSKDVLPYAKNDERYVIDDICEKAGIKCNYGGLNVSFSDHKQMRERSPLAFGKEQDGIKYQYKYAFPQYVNTIQIYETAANMQENGVRIVFSGHGGDEGISHRSNPYELYYHHEYYKYLRLMFSRSSVYKNRLISTLKLIKENQKEAKEELIKPLHYSDGGYYILDKDFVKELHPKEMKFVFAFDPKDHIIRGAIRNRLDVLAFFGAATGIRYLIPYVDYRLIDFALGIPRYLYHNWYINRFIFREAFKDLMPESLYRVKEKRDHSYDSLEQDNIDKNQKPDEEELKRQKEMAIKGRKELLTWLNKEYWEKYLDFKALDKWAEFAIDTEYDKDIFEAVCRFILVENMVKRSKELA